MWNELPEIIRYHRKQSGLSQAELADLAGTGKTVIFDLENNRGNARMETIQRVLKALNIQVYFGSPLMQDFKRFREKS